MSHDIPDRPWAKIDTDIFSNSGNDYLVTVDNYSNVWEVHYLGDTGARTIIGKLKAYCARLSFPMMARSTLAMLSPDSLNHGASHTWQVDSTSAKSIEKLSPQWRPANKSWESVLTLTVIHSYSHPRLPHHSASGTAVQSGTVPDELNYQYVATDRDSDHRLSTRNTTPETKNGLNRQAEAHQTNRLLKKVIVRVQPFKFPRRDWLKGTVIERARTS